MIELSSARRLIASTGRHAVSVAGTLVSLLVFSIAHKASAAVTCTLSSSTLAFGTVNPFSASSVTSGSLGYSCTASGPTAATVSVCLSLGTGSGGTTPSNRTLASGASTIPIQITGGASNPANIGNGTSYPQEGPFTLSVPKASTASSSLPLALTMPQKTPAPAPGSYTSTFSGTDAQMSYTSTSAPSTCAALTGLTPQTTTGTLSITATIAT